MSQVNLSSAPLSHAVKTELKTIYKFGGSSLANAKCFRKVARIIEKNLAANDLVVVSAAGQTTDWLEQIAAADSDANNYLQKLRYFQLALIHESIPKKHQRIIEDEFENDCQWIERLLELGQTNEFKNDILAFGEVWSAKLLCKLLESQNTEASWIDARQYLKVCWINDGFQVDLEQSKTYLDKLLLARDNRISIVTGFIASDCENNTVTLGRNGSDYSATLLAQLSNADKVVIWTDVSGIYSFDPNLCDDAQRLTTINEQLVLELSALGSPILHAKTLEPIKNSKAQVSIRSTFAPELQGSTICQNNSYAQNTVISHKNELTRFDILSENEIDTQRVIQSLQHVANHVENEFLLILKKSADRIHVLVNQSRTEHWQTIIAQLEQNVKIANIRTCATLAIVFENSLEKPYHKDFFHTFLDSLKDKHSTIIPHNNALICLFEKENIDSIAIKCYLDWSLFQSTTAIFLLGTGNVGATWNEQFEALASETASSSEIKLKANSRYLSLFNNRHCFDNVQNTDARILQLIIESPFRNKIVIDATASDSVSNLYLELFKNGIHLISANKISSSSSQDNYEFLNGAAKENNVLWQQNATIGAGLPINYALKDLVNCGDKIIQVRGVFSGTLSWLLNEYDGTLPFIDLVLKAKDLGYSEPDPRIDLSGKDVARKLIIAARLAGFSLNESDIKCVPVVAEEFLDKNEDFFWDNASVINEQFHQLWKDAREKQNRLVYEANFSPENGAYSQLVSVPESDPLAQISPCDNIFEIKTQWYNNNPLIIRGPGAGREVTAAAIQSDLNTILQQLNKG